MLLIGLAFVELSVQSYRRLERSAKARERDLTLARPSGSPLRDALEGFRLLLTSKYLLGIALVIVFYTTTNTFLYLFQGKVVEEATPNRDQRTEIFAGMDLYTNLAALALQLLLTGRLLRWLGVGLTQALLPAASIVGFLLLAARPALGVLSPFQILRRGGDYGMAKPAREVLFTAVDRRDKYLSKNVVDTFVYRANDALTAILYKNWIEPSAAPAILIAWTMIPVSVAWIFLALWLGSQYRARRGDARA
jgi:AAA family ATP:ADP antiporter